jgi:YebC/PmpR family DNA-binding regulatory protein
MSGHSHWAGIRRKKEIVDAKKGRLFSKLTKIITTAARQGGGDPNANTKLGFAIEQARAANMPKDNIERAIRKGTGELEGAGQIFEPLYEGYGPGGVAILAEAITDNRNRTGSEIRYILESFGGSLGASGCVSWMFEKKGLFIVEKNQAQEDQLTEIALEGGGEDLDLVGDAYQITCQPQDFSAVKKALLDHGIPIASAQVASIPKTTCAVDEQAGRKVIALLEKLEDHDDVQSVHSNVEFSERLLAEVSRA